MLILCCVLFLHCATEFGESLMHENIKEANKRVNLPKQFVRRQSQRLACRLGIFDCEFECFDQCSLCKTYENIW